MIPTCAIPLPLGYDIWSMQWVYSSLRSQEEIRVLWTSPNGRPIYVLAVATEASLRTDEFWQTMLDQVQAYVRGSRTNQKLTGEKNERVPTIIDAEPTTEPTATARVDSQA